MAFVYRSGPRVPVLVPLDADTTDIVIGRAVTITDATGGYFKGVDASGEGVEGIAMQKVTSPSADGGASVLIDISTQSIYEVPADAGTLVITENANTCDVGADGLSINHDASVTDDIYILTVDTARATALVQIRRSAVIAV